MKKYTNRKKKWIAYYTGLLTGIFCLMLVPLAADANIAAQYYQIFIGNQPYGCFDSSQEAVRELNRVRRRLQKEQGEIPLTNVSCSVEPVEKVMKTSGVQSLEKDLCEILKKTEEKSIQKACTIRVNEFTVTVASMGAVTDTLESIKNKYDTGNFYDVTLESSGDALYLVPEFHVKEGVDTQGMQEIGFAQEIQIVQSYVDESEITTPVSAAAALTKEWETPEVYTVEKGDCLSLIAENHGMLTKELAELNLLENPDEITIGDELVVTVPKPEVSVWYKIQAAYEEEYQAETQYIDNSSWYTGTEKVIQEGSTGRRYVVADILYNNGSEVSRDILQETIQIESQPRIVERGTSTPPTYIKPLVGGRFSSPFGSRWGRMHKGIDWSCSVGTTIKASSGGTVSSAGWVNGYGYCITISHSDGKKTRYAHLSKILVSAGEKVKQGEKIALSGNTGNSTGPHLHFEIIVNGSQVNPLKYLE